MELRNPNEGETLDDSQNPNDGGGNAKPNEAQSFGDKIDSNCSTPYVSAPSSPGRSPSSGGYFFSAPASPMHYVLSSVPFSAVSCGGVPRTTPEALAPAGYFEFDGADPTGAMVSADELFLNGQIRPTKLSSHLQRPQNLLPLLGVNEEEEEEEDAKEGAIFSRGRELRSGSVRRRARSMSPTRNSRFQWEEEEDEEQKKNPEADPDLNPKDKDTVPSDSSASSSRSSSSGRNSKRWIFLKDLLYRSKSEGRERISKEKFWHSISFSPSKEKSKPPPIPTSEPKEKDKTKPSKRPTNGVGKRRGPLPSAHERHYTAKRAQAEEMRKRTFLPYRQGLLGCLGFSSRSYGAFSGFTKTLNTVSST